MAINGKHKGRWLPSILRTFCCAALALLPACALFTTFGGVAEGFVPFVPRPVEGTDLFAESDAHLLPDDLHPNGEGYELMGLRAADLVLPRLLANRTDEVMA